MWCSTCQHDNDAGAVFCSYCGTAFNTIPPGNKPNTGSTVDLGRRQAVYTAQPFQQVTIPQPPVVIPPPAPSHSQAPNYQALWRFIIGAFVAVMLFRWVLVPMLGLVFKLWWIPLIVLIVFLNRGHSCSKTRHRHRRTWHH